MTSIPDDIQSELTSIGNSTAAIRTAIVAKGVTPTGGLSSYADAISSMSGNRNIGEIITSIIPLVDAGLHLLDGTLISGSGSYSAFVNYIAELYNIPEELLPWNYNGHTIYTLPIEDDPLTLSSKLYNIDGTEYRGSDFVIRQSGDYGTVYKPFYLNNVCDPDATYDLETGWVYNTITVPKPAYFCTEAEWQTAVTTYGVCGKFVYDSTNNTVRLPKYSNKIYTQELDNNAPVVGNGMTLGLIDGTTNYGLVQSGGNVNRLDTDTAGYGVNVGSSFNGSSSSSKTIGVTTDSTKSGIIADLASITTSLDGYYYIVIATSAKTDIQVDIDEIATDLNGKADTDLTNINNTAKVAIIHNATPSDLYIDLTLGADGAAYYAPADGFVSFGKWATEGGQTVGVYSRDSANKEIGGCKCISYTNQRVYVFLPVRKGQQFRAYWDADGELDWFRFIYAVGSESEAQ